MSDKTKFLWTVKVSDKGQIAIPKEAREIFDINTGDTLLLLDDTNRGIAIVKYEDYAELAHRAYAEKEGINHDKNQ